MSFPVTYHDTMTEVANLAMNRQEPGYVRVRALVTLVRELSPLNERCAEVKRELGIDETSVSVQTGILSESEAYMKGVRDGIASVQCECRDEDDEFADEDDDPL
ncbi:MAG: hypothetical protein OXN86_11095 [Chloroflexota bacterium]|nr:hypothetical protein [Chloroflexota bacterium]